MTIETAPADAPTPAAARAAGRVDGPATQRGVIASEWLKFRSLRSTLLVLAAAVAGMVVFGAVIAYNTRNPAGLDPEDVVASGPLQGYYLGQLLMAALGVLVVSGEYSSGMIRATLAAVPKRLPVLVAKAVVFTAVVGISMVAASVVAFLVAQAVLSGHRPTYSLSDGSTLRVVLGTGVYLTLVGLIGSALAWIVRSTPGALVATLAVILVVPILLELVFPSWGTYIAAYLPTGAGQSFSTSLPIQHALSPWVGLAVMAAWVCAGMTAAAVVLKRRDV
ncbi:ABC transporter permease [Nocardioides sp. Root1257]|uniref:ABC transporter permease n=1 Tax=unclassified Nocardioides TaxID=2615069 RepID=UPI0006FA6E8D|nr:MULTISPECIES: ABC transporter permease [unclassified Nocardioides]KQW49292.1 ABC transporter permease [Nocardioides sp. Root1257]KRC48466.1 ABC transporter permease [Nocardioides sp. Root224]